PAAEPISPPIAAPQIKPESAGRLEIRIEEPPPPAPRPAAPRVPAPPVTDPGRARVLELEAGLARSPALYFFLDPAARLLEVRSRGLALDRVPVLGLHVLHHHSLFGSGPTPAPDVPAVWKVKDGPGDFAREVIAPEELRPYEPEEKRQAAPASEDEDEETPIPTPPTAYQVPLTNGWALAILDREPRTSFLRRYAQAVRAGWRGVLGRHASRAPLVAVIVSAEDAQRIHHIFRTDIAVLVASGPSHTDQ
ncbi:MAG: hypothetical protein L0027_16965, partial [Candidatus Rokubacteria bacterium]|nr:hypothetical protein [Candidatus Rokubacteria bacterium]